MENSVDPEKKQSILKSLAIAGLLGITILIAWLAVQIVQVFPAALSSLVGVAHSVYNYNPLEMKSIDLDEQATLVNADEAFSISWDKPRVTGTYTFTYGCSEGVTVSLSADEKSFSDLTCDTEYDLGDTDSVKVFINTAVNRFTDVAYTIAFYRPNSTTPTAKREASVTIVNAAIGESDLLSQATSTETTTPSPTITPPVVEVTLPPEPVKPSPEPTVTPKPTSTPVATKPTPTAKPKPTTPEYIYTYAVPASNPNGTADLAVSIAGLGRLDENNRFVRTDSIVRGVPGAIQFVVHNLGDKTSTVWSYRVKLPGDTLYSSENEKALLPNERSVITVSYPAITTGYLEDFSITVTTNGVERTLNNNTAGATDIVL